MGVVFHLGVIIFIIGIWISSYQKDYPLNLVLNKPLNLEDKEITLIEKRVIPKKGFDYNTAKVEIKTSDDKIYLYPKKRYFKNKRGGTRTEVGLKRTLFFDHYIILHKFTESGGIFEYYVNYGMFWIWFGGILIIIEGFLLLFRRLYTS